MSLSRWCLLLAVMMVVGFVQVAQRNALFLQAYQVGVRTQRLHEQRVELAWLKTRVVGLSAPHRLSQTVKDNKMKLVAYSTLQASPLRLSALVDGTNDQ